MVDEDRSALGKVAQVAFWCAITYLVIRIGMGVLL
jgi:hypothetical protein